MARRSKTRGSALKERRRKAAKPSPSTKTLRRGRSLLAELRAQLKRSTDELNESRAQRTTTADILRIIRQSPTNAQPVFEALVLSAVHLLKSDQVWFVRCDSATYSAVAIATPEGLLADTGPKNVPIDPEANFPSRVIVQKKNLHVPDWSAINLPKHQRQIQETWGVKGGLYVPLLHENECIGLFAFARKHVQPFSEHEIALAESFRDQAAIAIENTRLFNETKDALERQMATADILKVIAASPSNVQPVFEAIAERANHLVAGHATAVHRIIDGQQHLMAFTRTNPEADAVIQSTFPRPLFVLAGAGQLASGKVFEVTDTARDFVDHPALLEMTRKRGARSIVIVPLMRGSELIGLINVSRAVVGRFDTRDVDLLRTFADQAVIAIENARLFNETKEALERQTATADVLNVISRSPTDAAPVFDVIGERAEKLCDAEISVVSTLDDDLIRVAGIRGISRESVELFRAHFPMPLDRATITARTIKTGAVVHVSDVLADTSYDNKVLAEQTGYRSCLGVPMHREGQVVGAIFVARTEPGQFSENQIRLLQIFADQAVIAIQNVKLFDEVQARTSELSEALQQQTATADVLKVISRSTFDLPTVLQTLVESAAQLCDADKTNITRQKNGAFYRAEAYGFSPEFQKYAQDRVIEAGRSSGFGRALLEGRVVHIADVLSDPEYTWLEGQKLGDYRTVLAVPMLRERGPIGVLTLTRTDVRPFTDKQIELATTFADQAAIAIENVRLFESVEARTRELQKSLEDLRTAQDRLVQTEKLASLGQLTAGIAHEIKNPLNFVNNFSALSAELVDEITEVLDNRSLDEESKRKELDEIRELLKSNLEKVVQHGKRADSIVKNMLQHSREGSGERRSQDINALVSESLNLAYHGARAERSDFNITLKQDLDPGAGTAEVFPQELTRALLNLISNGFYAAIRRKIEASGEPFEPMLTVATKIAGDAVEIRIRDNGTGIPAEIREKIFNPFFTTKPTGEGTGLGLSMAHDIIVKQHSGRLNVETEPGVFTEFIVTLPRGGNVGELESE